MKPAGKTPVIVKKNMPRKPGKPSALKKYSLLLLVLVPLAVYFNVIMLQYTGIDDSLFIVNSKEYNRDASHIFTSFQRGLFQPADKSLYDYYRPLFLVDMIAEYHFFGDDATGYHCTNLLFHILSVILLFQFLKKIRISETTSLILALLFAVHPALSQAVSWIPGRNDMMLMIFLLAGLIFTVNYALSRKWQDFVLQMVFFLLAMFTKETAIIIPLLALLILLMIFKIPWKSLFSLGIGWGIVITAWLFMESSVKQSGNKLPLHEMAESGISRVPAFLQYLGKIFFPVNLSVHPVMNEISIVWGLLALAATIALIHLFPELFQTCHYSRNRLVSPLPASRTRCSQDLQ